MDRTAPFSPYIYNKSHTTHNTHTQTLKYTQTPLYCSMLYTEPREAKLNIYSSICIYLYYIYKIYIKRQRGITKIYKCNTIYECITC